MSFKEQRRFPRVHVSQALREGVPQLGAQLTWPNHETSAVLDLSYRGMAVAKPGIYSVMAQQQLRVEIELGTRPAFLAAVRIAWCSPEAIGLEFTDIRADGHLALRDYLDLKLLGQALKPVERWFVAGGQDFQFWFQGGGTHVYVWMDGERVQRVLVDQNGEASEFVRGQRPRLSELDRRALLVLSQVDNGRVPMEEFVGSLLAGE